MNGEQEKFVHDSAVTVVKSSMSDADVIWAARVSVKGATHEDQLGLSKGDQALIEFLMKNRHGSPFEHTSITFCIKAPIFVWREFMRHRIGISYNEESGRYKQLDPHFFVPGPERKIIQEGKPGHYTYVEGSPEHYAFMEEKLMSAYIYSYQCYREMLQVGIAREVARMCLPVGILSSAYVTMNARSIMNFLSLRSKDEKSTFPSFPQREIEAVAEQIETYWALEMPITQYLFRRHGSVAP